MCLGDWKTHGSEYYECSRYKENPDIVNQSQQAQAREALKKYLFYFERVGHHLLGLSKTLTFPPTLPRAEVNANNDCVASAPGTKPSVVSEARFRSFFKVTLPGASFRPESLCQSCNERALY